MKQLTFSKVANDVTITTTMGKDFSVLTSWREFLKYERKNILSCFACGIREQ
jgi:hypothetical protein